MFHLLRGRFRRWIVYGYYRSLQQGSWIVRFWAWLHYAEEDKVVANSVEWAFNLNETVRIKNTKYIGIIWWRWMRFGQKIYEIKIAGQYYLYYEWGLIKTKYRLYSEVKINEIPFNKLAEGHYCSTTKRWTCHQHWTSSVPRVAKV